VWLCAEVFVAWQVSQFVAAGEEPHVGVTVSKWQLTVAQVPRVGLDTWLDVKAWNPYFMYLPVAGDALTFAANWILPLRWSTVNPLLLWQGTQLFAVAVAGMWVRWLPIKAPVVIFLYAPSSGR
jgi:hypothetical protein